MSVVGHFTPPSTPDEGNSVVHSDAPSLSATTNLHRPVGECERGHPCHHVRRKFYELADSSPVATEVLRRIAQLYAVEDEVCGSSAEHRRLVRGARSRIIPDDLRQYLDARGRQVSAKRLHALDRRGLRTPLTTLVIVGALFDDEIAFTDLLRR